jgi:hypothetical protein
MRKKAQSINEYAMVIAIITLAAVSMQTYVKRGIQGVIKLSADDLMVWSDQEKLAELTPKPKLDLPDGDITDKNKWHPAAREYVEDYGGFIHAEKTGNEVSYYHFTSDPNNQTLIGKEDVFTRDFTGFDIDGFANGVVNEVNMPYRDLTFSPGVTCVTVEKKVVAADGTISYKDIGTYGKHQRVRLSSSAAGEAAAQQKGIEESGLYDYKQTSPLKVTSNKTLTVKESALSSVTIANTSYHVYVRENFRTTDAKAEIKGNNVNYYLIATGSLIGIEDALTNDFTLFGKDGFVDSVLDVNGNVYDLEFNENKDAGKVVSITIKKDGKEIGTYTKYQPVSIGAVSATSPFLGVDKSGSPAYKVRETVSSETTNVSGKWEATYKLGAETFGSLEKKKLGTGGGPPSPPLPTDTGG